MKNKMKLCGIIFFAAVIVFSMVGCNNNTTINNTTDNGDKQQLKTLEIKNLAIGNRQNSGLNVGDSVPAINLGKSNEDDESSKHILTDLEVPANITADIVTTKGTIIYWDPVEGAMAYEVKIKLSEPELSFFREEFSFGVEKNFFVLPFVGNAEVSVRAFGNGITTLSSPWITENLFLRMRLYSLFPYVDRGKVSFPGKSDLDDIYVTVCWRISAVAELENINYTVRLYNDLGNIVDDYTIAYGEHSYYYVEPYDPNKHDALLYYFHVNISELPDGTYYFKILQHGNSYFLDSEHDLDFYAFTVTSGNAYMLWWKDDINQ